MRQLTLVSIFLLIAISFVHAIVIIPPVVYFVTLSISTFISSSVVSLLLFGALKGFADRKYFGKSLFDILQKIKSGVSTFIMAISCMFLALLAIYPIDLESTLIAAAISAALFLLLKFVFSLREFGALGSSKKRSLLISWLALALFIGIAFSFSALLSIQSYRVITGSGGGYPSQQAEKSPLAPLAELLTGQGAPSSAESQNLLIAPTESKKSSSVPSEAQGSELIGAIQAPSPSKAAASPTSAPASLPEQKIWFIPQSAAPCTIFADSSVQSFTPSYSCLS